MTLTERRLATSGVPDRPESSRQRTVWAQVARGGLIAAVIAVIALFTAVPLGFLLWNSLVEDGHFTLSHYVDAYSRPDTLDMIWTSVRFSVGSTLVAVVLGTGLAYLVSRTDAPFKGLILIGSLIPLVIPGILYTISWILLASPRIGLLNDLSDRLTGTRPLNIFSLEGMILVEGVHAAPIVFLLMMAAFRNMDPALEESALMSGARLSTVVRAITLPLVKPALYSSILIMTVLSLGAFEVPALLGTPSGNTVLISQLWDALRVFPINYSVASAYSIGLITITVVGVYLHSRLNRRAKGYQTVTGKGFRPRPMELRGLRWPIGIIVLAYFSITVVAPVLVLLYTSLQGHYAPPTWETITNPSLHNYVAVFEDDASFRALRNSLVLGVSAGVTVMAFMAVAAWISIRTNFRGRWIVDGLASVPIGVPGLVMGVAILFLYLRVPLPIYGTLWILFIAYFTRYMPYGMRYASASMQQISSELEDAAHTSGATWWQTFRRVNVPLLMPGLIAGWSYIFLVSFRELQSSLLLYPPGEEVLAVLLWRQWQNGALTQLAALGVIMILVLAAVVTLVQWLGAKVGVRTE